MIKWNTAAVNKTWTIIGHLPWRLSRVCSLFVTRGHDILHSDWGEKILHRSPSRWAWSIQIFISKRTNALTNYYPNILYIRLALLKTYLQQKWVWQYAQNLEQGHCYISEKLKNREAAWYSSRDAKECVLSVSEATTTSRPLLFGCLPFVIPPGPSHTLLLRASLHIS